MLKKPVKLIVADIDGTMRGTPKETVSDRTLEDLRKIRDMGIYFGIASGRSIKNVTGYAKAWGLDYQFDLCIAINGAQLYDNITGKIYQDRQLHAADIEKIMKHIEPLGMGVSFFTDSDVQYITHMTDQLREAQQRNNYEYIIVGNDYSVFDTVPVNKVMLRVPEGEMDRVEAFVAEHPFDEYDSFKTQPVCYEVVPKGITKASAIAKFCQLHGIEDDEVITFGDTSNDNSMLEKYYGVCLKSGTADTLAIADEITELDAADDGFADYLEKHIIK